jgi:hypothetical protein|tara:strand:- start:12343 stop:12648 length:306 start_codon:yes stop_codon:yes gene_type:complete
MPYNPSSYALHRHNDIKHILDSALESESGVFIPTNDDNKARSLQLSLGRFRSAVEVQHDNFSYSYLTFKRNNNPPYGVTVADTSINHGYQIIDVSSGETID